MSCASAKPGGSLNPYLPLAVVRAEPATSVVPPDATLIRQVGAEGFENITGWQGAFFGHVYGTQLSIDEVFAFHDTELTKLGWKDIVVLEQNQLGGGTTWHAAGLVGQLRATQNLTRLAQYTTQLYEGLERETGQATVVLDGAAYRVVFDARIDGTLQPCPYVPRPLTTLPPPRP